MQKFTKYVRTTSNNQGYEKIDEDIYSPRVNLGERIFKEKFTCQDRVSFGGEISPILSFTLTLTHLFCCTSPTAYSV